MSIFNNSDFLDTMEDYRPFLFKNTDYDLFDWKHAIDVLDTSFKQEPDSIKLMKNNGYILHEFWDRIPQIKVPMHDIMNALPTKTHSAHIYMALSSLTQGFGKHVDQVEVFFWQVIGHTKWTVHVTPSLTEEFVLSPRDILYIPSSMPHDVASLTPRIGVSMAA